MDTFERERQAKDLVEAEVARHTVGIVHGSNDQKWQGIGTGCAVYWKGNHLILTADHVVRDTHPDDLRFFSPRGVLKRIEDRSALLNLPGVRTESLTPAEQLQIENPIRDEALDIAAIRLRAHDDRIQFFPVEIGGISPVVGDHIVFMGFPHDISRLTRQDDRVAFTSVDWSEIVPHKTGLDSRYDPKIHALMPYFVTEEYPDANPHGFSGAGAWTTVKVPQSKVWYPKLVLAGLVIGYYRRSNVLQIVRRETLEEFLKQRIQ